MADTEEVDEGAADDQKTERTCFVISPIGNSGSRERRRADGLLNGVIKPAVENLNVEVTRADTIEQHGMITSQVVRRIVEADLVVADLSGANPNVYYELGIADSFRIPVVRFVDEASRLPFDAKPDRTIELADTDGSIEVLHAHKAQKTFAGFARAVFNDGGEAESIVVVAQQRASFDRTLGPSTTTEEMLRILMTNLDDLRGRGASSAQPLMDAREALARLWRQAANDDAEIFIDGEGGFIVDVGYAPSADLVLRIEAQLEAVAGPQTIKYLHGVTKAADPVYGDEEPF